MEKESAAAEGERGNRKSKEMYVQEEKVRNTSQRENYGCCKWGVNVF